ncbi:MAG: hypothetical protein WC480_00860 [Patescibacteria group bacterium]
MLKKISAILVIGFLVAYPAISLASTTDGTIDSTYKYAWGENIGWLNFGNEGGDIHVTDNGLTGYAWSANYGWINLDPTTSGVANDGEGDLSGYAWGENLGWIDFANVSIDDDGQFTGTATGTISGVVTFDCTNCDVRTDWRPASTRSGGGTSRKYPPADTSITINNYAATTSSTSVTLNLAATNATQMIIANSADFAGASWETFATTKNWTLTDGDGQKTVYTQFKNTYGQSGIVSDSITLATPSQPGGGTTPPPTPPANNSEEGDDQQIEEPQTYAAGSLVKAPEFATVYYIGDDAKRHIFPDEHVYFSHYSDFSQVLTIPLTDLQQYPLGANMTYKPGSLVKLTTDPKVYRVDTPNILRWIVSEEVFYALGYNFSLVHDLSDAYWLDYTVGPDITSY